MKYGSTIAIDIHIFASVRGEVGGARDEFSPSHRTFPNACSRRKFHLERESNRVYE